MREKLIIIGAVLMIVLLFELFCYGEVKERERKELARAHEAIGIEFYEEEKFDAAEGALKQAIEKDSSLWEAHFYLGTIYFERSEWDKAKSEFEKVVELNQNIAEAYTALGILVFRQKNYDKSIEYFEKSLKLNPEDKHVKGLLEVVERVK